jgi:hypothetical protein
LHAIGNPLANSPKGSKIPFSNSFRVYSFPSGQVINNPLLDLVKCDGKNSANEILSTFYYYLDLKLSNVSVGVAKTFCRTSANEASMGTPCVFNLHLKFCKRKMQFSCKPS